MNPPPARKSSFGQVRTILFSVLVVAAIGVKAWKAYRAIGHVSAPRADLLSTDGLSLATDDRAELQGFYGAQIQPCLDAYDLLVSAVQMYGAEKAMSGAFPKNLVKKCADFKSTRHATRELSAKEADLVKKFDRHIELRVMNGLVVKDSS